MTRCVFCRAETNGEPREHIIPEGLIGEPLMHVSGPVREVIADRQLILDQDEVCRRCNRDVAVLDKRLQDELGLMKVMLNRSVTKRGRLPRYERPGILAEREAGGGSRIILNSKNKPIQTADGLEVQPAKNGVPSARLAEITRNGPVATIQIEQPIPLSKKTFRALHKIAFEMLALQFGPEAVLDEYFDPVRSYVRRGKGSRVLYILNNVEDPEGSLIDRPGVTIHQVRHREWLVEVRLGLVFYVDLSPGNDLDLGTPEDLQKVGLTRLPDDYLAPQRNKKA
jgi:hypothetical protein